jgi:hypothetical protein
MMREPKRLADSPASEVEARLLQVGRSYRASLGTKTRALAAVSAAGASSSLAGAAAAQLLGSKLGMLAAAGVAVSVAATGYILSGPAAPDMPPTVVAAPPAARTPEPVQASAGPSLIASPSTSQSPSPAPVEAAPARPVPENAVTRSAKPAVRAARSAPSLQDELARLDAASALLRAGSAAQALAELDRYDRDFSPGKLQMESRVLRIEALARAGQVQRAQALADAFLKRHSASVLAARVRRYATPP